MKICWRVQPEPSGKYRYFERRGWPYAETVDGAIVFMLDCPNEYRPRDVRDGKHDAITIFVRCGRPDRTWVWRRLNRTAKTLADAKRLAQAYIDQHPDHDYAL